MRHILLALGAAGPAAAAFCYDWGSGPTSSSNYIRVANATLIVPSPSPQQGLLSLWTGMGTTNGDLIQALVESYSGDADGGCGPLSGSEWCAWSSTLNGSGQVGGQQYIVTPGDHVQQSYIYNDATKQYDQYTIVNGEIVSTFQTTSGYAQGWGTNEECQPEQPCGYTPAHDWVDVTLVMDAPEPQYSQTFGSYGASADMGTSDGGLTWTATQIHIDACDFNFAPDASYTPPPPPPSSSSAAPSSR